MGKCNQCGFAQEQAGVYCANCGAPLPQAGDANQISVPGQPGAATGTEQQGQREPVAGNEMPSEPQGFSPETNADAWDAPDLTPPENLWGTPPVIDPIGDNAQTSAGAQPPRTAQAAPVDHPPAEETAGTEQPEAEVRPTNPMQPEANPTVYCVKCGNKVLQNALFCAVCGTKAVKVVPSEEMVPVSQPYFVQEHPAPEPQKAKKGGKKTLVIAVLAAVLFVACVGVFIYAQLGGEVDLPGSIAGLTGGRRNTDADRPLVYVQDGDALKYRTSSMEKSQVVNNRFNTRSDSWWLTGSLSFLSEDGTYLLYLNDFRQQGYSYDGRGELYLRDLSELTEAGEVNVGTKIATDVSLEFYMTPDNKYVFYVNSKGELYAWDFEEAFKIDSDVTGVYDFSSDKVFYYKGDVDDYYTSYYTSRDAYVAPLDQSGRDSREKVDTDINDMLDWNEDFTEFLYTKPYTSRTSDQVTFDLYQYNLTEDRRETLVTDVDEVVSARLETGEVLFLRVQDDSLAFDDLIEDDMLESDALLTEPDMADYPLLEQYYDYIYSYYNYYNDPDLDYDAMMEEFDRYEEAQAEYEAKERRDRLRNRFEGELEWSSGLYEISLYEMYYLADGDRQKIDSDIYTSISNYGTRISGNLYDGFAAYVKADPTNLPKLKLSEMESSYYAYDFDMEEYIKENLKGELYVSFLNGSTHQLTSLEDDLEPYTYDVHITEDGSGLYYQAEDLSKRKEKASSYGSYSDYSYYPTYTRSYNLYYVPVNGASLGESRLVDTDIQSFSFKDVYDGKEWYITGTKDDVGDLYAVFAGERERIAYDVSSYEEPAAYQDGQVLLYFENYNTNRDLGELFMLKNGEKVKVYDDVYEYYYRGDDLIYLMCNYRSEKGDLYVYDGEKVEIVDYDVTAVIDDWYWYLDGEGGFID